MAEVEQCRTQLAKLEALRISETERNQQLQHLTKTCADLAESNRGIYADLEACRSMNRSLEASLRSSDEKMSCLECQCHEGLFDVKSFAKKVADKALKAATDQLEETCRGVRAELQGSQAAERQLETRLERVFAMATQCSEGLERATRQLKELERRCADTAARLEACEADQPIKLSGSNEICSTPSNTSVMRLGKSHLKPFTQTVSFRVGGDTWCTGCAAWETIGLELCNSWSGPGGLRRIAEDIVLSAARQVRALRAVGAGSCRAPAAGASSGVKAEEEEEKQEKPAPAAAIGGLAAKHKVSQPQSESEEYTYTEEEVEEDEEPKQEARETKEIDKRPTLPRRSREGEKKRPLEEEMAEEGTEAEKLQFGEEVRSGDPKWVQLLPEVGQILEAVLTPGDVIKEEAKIAILVTEVKEETDGELIYVGRYVGGENEEIGKYCSMHINRKELGVHICRENPCPGVASKVAGHVMRGAMWEAAAFDASYMRAWGKMVIKEYVEKKTIKSRRKPPRGAEDPHGSGGVPGRTPKVPAGGDPPKDSKKDKKRKKDKKEKKEKRPRRSSDSEEDSAVGASGNQKDRSNVAGLRAKLAALRKRLDGHGRGEWEEIIDVDALSEPTEPEAFWPFAEVPPLKGLGTGDHLGSRVSQLALADAVKQEDTKDGTWSKRKKKVRVKKGRRGPRKMGTASQLLEVAEERQKERGKERKKGKRKKGSEKVRALVKALGEKKGKKRSRRKDNPDPSSSESSEEDSSEEGSSSSTSDMLAPLQKKSLRRPGAVLKMLTKHAQQTLDQTSVVEVQDGDTITQGVKMATYFNLLIRPYHPTNSRDMKELHYLSICIDELRSGKLGALGDSLASRFLAVHSAVNEGGWRTAQHLELHPLEGAQSAPTPLLLQARKHSKLIAKSQGREDQERGWRRGDGWKRDDWNDHKGKGKGAKGGKGPYGKGKGRGNYGKQGGKERSLKGRYKKGEEALPDEEEKEVREERKDPPGLNWGRGFEFVAKLAEVGSDLATLGCAMAWMVVQAEKHRRLSGRSKSLWSFLAGPFAGSTAVHRPLKKRTFPIRLGSLWKLWATLEDCSLECASGAEFVEEWKADAWLFNCVQYSNFLGGCRVFHWGRWRESDQRAIAGFKEAVARTLAQDGSVKRSVSEVEKELSSRFMSYTGEEIPKMEVLSISQVEPSLPPPSHGGAIRATDWVKGRTKAFLLHPDDCIKTSDEAGRLPKLQGKVHVVSEDKLDLAKLLVSRGICGWTEESDVFRFQGERVLNGMFGVPKGTCLEDGRPVLRLIMNLIPSNSVMRQLQGSVQELPGITQYLSVTLEEGESIRFAQSDMTAAFYLFGLEERWMRYLCFNLCVKGSEIGKVPSKEYFLSCKVLPMGWTSAVAVMQEISQAMLLSYGMPKELQVKRTRGLPLWLCRVLRDAGGTSKAWWHIYLDNFFAGERSQGENKTEEVDSLHSLAERAWAEIGVISSEKKRISGVEVVDELGARFNGSEQFLGASGERLVKILQTTALILSKVNVPKKWLQVVTGRRNLQLIDLGVTKQTQSRYYDAVRRLFPVVSRVSTFEQMDEQISLWIQKRFSQGEPLNNVADALSGMHYFVPASKKQLPQSWRLFGVWRKYELPSRAPPLTADLVLSFAGKCLQDLDFSLATLLLLGFHCCLRTGEILNIAADDVLVNSETGILHLKQTKGGVRHNTKESVTIECPIVREVVLQTIAIQKQRRLMNVPLWSSSGQAFRTAFYRLCKQFDVLHLNFRGYSLRRGGATAYFQACGSMERTLLRGRTESSTMVNFEIAECAPLYHGGRQVQEPMLAVKMHEEVQTSICELVEQVSTLKQQANSAEANSSSLQQEVKQIQGLIRCLHQEFKLASDLATHRHQQLQKDVVRLQWWQETSSEEESEHEEEECTQLLCAVQVANTGEAPGTEVLPPCPPGPPPPPECLGAHNNPTLSPFVFLS
eukprot:symbB.v1.2.020089.t2/scaffold1672.1/size106478/1